MGTLIRRAYADDNPRRVDWTRTADAKRATRERRQARTVKRSAQAEGVAR